MKLTIEVNRTDADAAQRLLEEEHCLLTDMLDGGELEAVLKVCLEEHAADLVQSLIDYASERRDGLGLDVVEEYKARLRRERRRREEAAACPRCGGIRRQMSEDGQDEVECALCRDDQAPAAITTGAMA